MDRVCSKDTLEKMHRMERALSCGVMGVTTMESIGMDRNMDRECIIGQMDQDMQENGSKMKCMGQENLYGQMVGSIKALL
jgi:hypothetical protein